MEQAALDIAVGSVLLNEAVHAVLTLKLQVVVVLVSALTMVANIRHAAIKSPFEWRFSLAIVVSGWRYLIKECLVLGKVLDVLLSSVVSIKLKLLALVMMSLELDRHELSRNRSNTRELVLGSLLDRTKHAVLISTRHNVLNKMLAVYVVTIPYVTLLLLHLQVQDGLQILSGLLAVVFGLAVFRLGKVAPQRVDQLVAISPDRRHHLLAVHHVVHC